MVIGICLIPLVFIVVVLIVLVDRHNPFYVQRRIGRYGETFSCYKFRTMDANAPVFASDARDANRYITKFGRFLRAANLDELPQLINIIKGDMSLVGPRPCLPTQTALIKLRNEKGIYQLRPGLTGLAQIKAYDQMPVTEKVQFDEIYLVNSSLFFDGIILFKTVKFLVIRNPVY